MSKTFGEMIAEKAEESHGYSLDANGATGIDIQPRELAWLIDIFLMNNMKYYTNDDAV